MDHATTKVKLDRDKHGVVVECDRADGSTGQVLVTVDAAEAIYQTLLSARAVPPLTDPDGMHVVTGFMGEPYAEEFHLILHTTGGQQAIFVFAAPGKTQDQVATVSLAIRDAMMRLLPQAN